MKKSILLLCFILVISKLAVSQSIQNSLNHSESLKTGEWLRDWYLSCTFPLDSAKYNYKHLTGFDTDFLKNIGGETDPDIKEGASIKYKGISARWERFTSPDPVVDLDKYYSGKSFVASYAYKELEVDSAGVYLVSLGTDDGGKLWVNGELVWDCYQERGIKDDDDLVPANFIKGKNTLLLKMEEREHAWGFKVRVLPFDLHSFVQNQPLFSLSKRDGSPELGFMQPSYGKLFKTVNVIVTKEGSDDIVWQGEHKGKKIVLPRGGGQYQKNLLAISATLSDGSHWEKEIYYNTGNPVFYPLFENGETTYSIVVKKDAGDGETWAAKELQHWLEEISGITFPIKTDDEKITENEIIIGYNKHSLSLLGSDAAVPKATNESYHYKNIGPSVLLLGGEQRGSMYAVFSFLENELGCRWYSPEVTVIPKKKKYSFNYLNHSESPSVRVRNDFYYEVFDNPDWAARNKINGAMDYREQHGGLEAYWSAHTFFKLLPPEEFFDTHPEYYSLIDGKRIHKRAQLCLSNPEVIKLATERLKKVMRENPEYLIYSVSQMDWKNACQCEKCQAIVDREKSQSGPLIHFINQIADGIKDEFPDKYVGTFAYQYTRKPPATIKPRENVVIRLCSIECCFAHDFKSCPKNKEFMEDMKIWSTLAPHLYIWDYVVSFREYLVPFPNFNVLQSNINSFIENNAIGIMEQAAYQCPNTEFAALRSYVIAKLLWNSKIDVDWVIDDFMEGYYGRSGRYIRYYFDLLHNLIKPETHFKIRLRHYDDLFNDEFVAHAERIFDEAEKVAENEEIFNRVELARLPILFLKCMRNPEEAKIDGSIQRFWEIVERENITHISEGVANNAEYKKILKIEE